MVIGHTLRGLETSQIISFAGDFGQADAAIYAFHMPLMFLMSGMFIHKALPQDWLRYTLKHAQRLIWPLILWTYIFFFCKVLAGGAANTPMGWQNFPVFPLPPREHFWFLWALFLGFLIIKGIYTLSLALRFRSVPWPLVTVIALLMLVLWLNSGLHSPWTQQALVYLPYILVGMSVRHWLFAAPLYVLFGSFAVAVITLFTPWGSVDALYDFGIAVSISLAIVAMLALLSNLVSFGWLVLIGQASMAIYLSHTIVSALFRAMLTTFDVRDAMVHILVGVASGLIVPLIAFVSIRNERALKIIGW